MNFLGFEDVSSDDDAQAMAALADALAFFDDSSVADAFATCSTCATPLTAVAASSSGEQQPTPTPAPPKPAPPKRNRKRNHVEVVHLRSQVVDLEARLAHLQRFCGATAAAPAGVKRSRVAEKQTKTGSASAKATAATVPATESVWFRKAVSEYKQLERAKQWNIDLRNEIEEQKRTSDTLEQLFQLKLSAQDLAFLDEVEAQSRPSAIVTEHDDPLDDEFLELLVRLENIYARTEEVVAKIALRDTRSVFDMSFNQVDAVLGRSFEFIVNTPLQHNYRGVENFLWSQVAANVLYECQTMSHRVVRIPEVNCIQKHFNLKFGEAFGNRSINGVIMARKVQERRRTVFAITGKISFPGSSLMIRQEGHIILSDTSNSSESGAASSPTSLMQSQFRISAEVQDGERVPTDIAKLRDFVLSFNAETIQSYHKRIQRVLLKVKNSDFGDVHQHDLRLGCIPCKMQASSLLIEGSHQHQQSLQ